MPTKQPFRVLVLASTRGTDFGAMLAEQRAGKLQNVEFVGLITNRATSGAAERAEAAGVPVFAYSAKSETYHQDILERAEELQPDLICLVGYMRILQPEFCQAFAGKILNIHPSLLPKYAGGMNRTVHEDVLKNNETETGMTIHLVTEELDAGAIICQKAVTVEDNDTPESLKEKVQMLEKQWYPEVIRWFRDDKVVVG